MLEGYSYSIGYWMFQPPYKNWCYLVLSATYPSSCNIVLFSVSCPIQLASLLISLPQFPILVNWKFATKIFHLIILHCSSFKYSLTYICETQPLLIFVGDVYLLLEIAIQNTTNFYITLQYTLIAILFTHIAASGTVHVWWTSLVSW